MATDITSGQGKATWQRASVLNTGAQAFDLAGVSG